MAHTQKIQSKIAKFQREREYVHNEIEQMSRRVLDCQRIVVKNFGSLVTGLALESSDMDMAVSGLEITDRNTLIQDLHNLKQALSNWDLIQDLKSIDTASVPVIKAKISLWEVRKLLIKKSQEEKQASENTEETKGQETDKEPEFEDIEEDDEEFLPIDITFDDSSSQNTNNGGMGMNGFDNNFNNMLGNNELGLGILGNLGGIFGGGANNFNFGGPKDVFGAPVGGRQTHLGIASCNLLKEYVETYPCLREVGILLKQFLAVHDLNSSYRGK